MQGHRRERRLLQIDNDELASFRPSSLGHVCCRRDTEAGAQTEHKVSLVAVAEASIEVLLPQILTKVDDCVFQRAAAARVVALPAGFVRLEPLSIASAKITHIVLSALNADLEVSIPVNLGDVLLRNARLAVQAISVLRDDVLKQATVHQLDHCHVSLRRKGLRHADALLGLGNVHGLSSFFRSLCDSAFFPSTSACRETSVNTGAIVCNACRGADTGACERAEMFRGKNHHCKLLDFRVEFLRTIEVFLLLSFSLKSSRCHRK